MADEIMTAAAAVVAEIAKIRSENCCKKKRMWARKWILRRNERGASNALVMELRAEDPRSFFNLLRINGEMFDFLLSKVANKIQKKDTIMREAIPAKLKLEVALRYLATGDSLTSLQYFYRIPKCTISIFLPAVFDSIYEALKDYIQVPKTEAAWNEITRGFYTSWNFPNCVGCIDGKHVIIQCPHNSGSMNYNYKGTFSIVLLAVADHEYNFTFIDVGSYGSVSDGGIFAKSCLFRAIERQELNLPKEAVILGDEAFPLTPYLMKPYPRRNELNLAQKVYNYRHCRARRIIENSFGIMAARFRVFRTTISLYPTTVIKLITAACALHNWIRKSGKEVNPITRDIEDHETGRIIPGSWRDDSRSRNMIDIAPSHHRNYLPEARQRRDDFATYFMGEGSLSFQYRMIQ